MERSNVAWKLFGAYLLILVLMICAGTANAQIKVIQFNAGWNSSNAVGWVQDLEDCKTISSVDINTNKEAQSKYKIAVIPTIIIFKDGDEVARFQADLSFKMVATREEVQEEISSQLMSDF